MKKILDVFILINTLVFTSFLAYGSHVPGGNITYQCLGNNQFQITLTLYEDCGTAFASDSDETIDITSDCGHNLTLDLTNTVYQQNISQLCPSSMGQSECNGGNLPGVYMHQWQGIITLPAQCDSWRFSFDDHQPRKDKVREQWPPLLQSIQKLLKHLLDISPSHCRHNTPPYYL